VDGGGGAGRGLLWRTGATRPFRGLGTSFSWVRGAGRVPDGCDTSFSRARHVLFVGAGEPDGGCSGGRVRHVLFAGSARAFPVDGSLEGGSEFLVLVEDLDAVEGDAVLERDFFDFRLQLVAFFEGEEVRDGGFDAEGLSAVGVGGEG
jgi:hypothetical protein